MNKDRAKVNQITIKNRTRLLGAFAFILFIMSVLCFRCGWWQIVKGEELADTAAAQQTRDSLVEAKRGVIYDRNKMELAVSGTAYSVWVRPADLKTADSANKKEDLTSEVISGLSGILEMDDDEVRESVTADQNLIKIESGLSKETADRIRELELTAVELSEDSRRFYPLGSFASHLIGSVSDDNTGLAGIEAYYNRYLTGVSGRRIQNTDVSGNGLSYGFEEYYAAEDGLGVVLTIDEVVQNYVEKAIASCQKKTQADRVMCLVMDTETAEILAMAVTPEYDPNNPREAPTEAEQKKLDSMSDKKKVEYWNKMWRNPLLQDTYEPGSTFKLMTTSIALEEGLTSPSETFYDNGSIDVSGETLKCWSDVPHGKQTLEEAVGNSCNPVFVTLGLRIGKERFYNYMELFGYDSITGIDYPSEATAILQNEDTAGPVDLATMAYGQGIAVTPIQLATAVSAIGNGGVMMKPHLVKELVDSDGKTVRTFEPEEVRQIISKQTSDEVCDIMEYVVSEGGAETAYVEGYRVGGKTGTANKPKAGGYSEDTYSSFIGMAPMNDPKVTVLVIVDSPVGIKYGSQTAAPCAQTIFKNILPYLGIETQYSDDETEKIEKNKTTVPDITGLSYEKAVSALEKAELKYKVQSGDSSGDSFKVKDQYPKAGTKVDKKSTVYIYGSK
ncbi:MAG: penicillin-binding transpeptidase domain-containing protein [Anaerovoracaceae bacterium]|nr:penicillin-binding transpeptidase domain-containing protein [Anaerovoracaceae bacterium]